MSTETPFSLKNEDVLSGRTYLKSQVTPVDHAVLDMTDEQVAIHDSLAVSQLRSCFLVSSRTDLKPSAVRFKLCTDVFPREWQRVTTNTEAAMKDMSANDWFFLGYVPHSVEFAVELQVLCGDGVLRIAKANNLTVHPSRRLGLVVLR